MTHTDPPILDGHNDVLSKLLQPGSGGQAAFHAGRVDGHVDLPRARAGGLGGGFFALWVPSDDPVPDRDVAMQAESYDLPRDAPVHPDPALRTVFAQAAALFGLEAAGDVRICTDTAELRACLAEGGPLAAILHLEGAEALDPELHALDLLYRAGLRSLGPVWSRETIFGEGVPFRFPGDPDTGAGLTEAGHRLVTRCNDLGILLDLSHINAAGFWDVARTSRHPLVATHSNAHALTPHARNLTDDQLRAVAESGGVVGINFAVAFLRADGRMEAATPLDRIARHLEHMIGILGEDGVAFGSDFDGATVPEDLGDAAGLGRLRSFLEQTGVDGPLMRKLCHENWLRVLDNTWAR